MLRQVATATIAFACITIAIPAAGQEVEPETVVTAAVPADPVTVAAEPGAVRALLRAAAKDFKYVPSRESRRILLTGAVLGLIVLPADRVATHGAASSTTLKAAFGTTGKLLGEEYVQGGTALAAYLTGRILGRPQLRQVGADLIEAQLFSAVLTQPIKLAVQRTRPDGEARSFPSGHASASFATASVLQRHFGRRAAIPAYGAAMYIAASRLQGNSHYASDLMVGAALGIVAGRAATIEVADRRMTIAPAPVRGGATLLVTVK